MGESEKIGTELPFPDLKLPLGSKGQLYVDIHELKKQVKQLKEELDSHYRYHKRYVEEKR